MDGILIGFAAGCRSKIAGSDHKNQAGIASEPISSTRGVRPTVLTSWYDIVTRGE
jgi:hypothetical protein